MSTYFTNLSLFTIAIITLSSFLIVPLLTYLSTTFRFGINLRTFTDRTSSSEKNVVVVPQLPYTVPWLGNSISFLSTTPNKFWKGLFSWYPGNAGAIRILLGGNKTTVIFNTTSAQYILRDRKMGREIFNEQVVMNGFAISKSECNKFYEHGKTAEKRGQLPGHAESDRVNLEYMLRTERVNELTTEFVKNFKNDIASEFVTGSSTISLNSWLRTLMFKASTTALLGSKILEVTPDLETYFFRFDADMLSLFFGLPKWMIRKKYVNRDLAMDRFEMWYDAIERDIGKDVPDPETIVWEPCYGSRVARARQLLYRRQGISKRTMAGLDLGLLFGIASNAIPAAGWVLMHIIDSTRPERRVAGEPTLYDYIMPEVKEAEKADGTLDVTILVNQPIFLSVLHEVLRFYVDTLISRMVPTDVHIPLPGVETTMDANLKSNSSSRSIFLKAGEMLMLPTWPSHNNPAAWSSTEFPHNPAPDVFYPYRFLTAPPTAKSTDKPIFTTSHTTGTFFPFGGGKTICPGRTFAKQEIMAAVAMILLTFDLKFESFVNSKGHITQDFPGLRDTLPGSAVMVANGDMKVKMTRQQ